MSLLIDLTSWVLLLSGVAICVIGGIGMLRMPDFYTRSHAASLTDTLGAALVLIGLALQAGLTLITVKLGFVLMLLFITSPTSAHALMKSAYSHGVAAPKLEDQRTAGSPGSEGGEA